MSPGSYYGEHERKLDYKGRIGVPDDLVLDDEAWKRVVLVRGSAELESGRLFCFVKLFDAFSWQTVLDSARRATGMDAEELRLFMHREIGDAATVELDAMKRITIPQRFLEHATIERQAASRVLGMIDHLEIWNPQLHEEYIEAMNASGVLPPSWDEVARRAPIREVS